MIKPRRRIPIASGKLQAKDGPEIRDFHRDLGSKAPNRALPPSSCSCLGDMLTSGMPIGAVSVIRQTSRYMACHVGQ
jgi:hypothetical protein